MPFARSDANSTYPTSSSIGLTSDETAQLRELAAHLSSDPESDPEGFCRQAERAAAALPDRVADALRDLRRSGSPAGMLMLSGLTLPEPPPTPENNREHLGERTLLARVQAIVNHGLGSMIAYEGEGAGRLFQDMVPSKAAIRTQTSLGSAVELEVHTEQAFSELRPDYLSLACLRGDDRARTYLITARQILAWCAPEQRELLRTSLWTTSVDMSFLGEHEFLAGEIRGPMSILTGAEEDPFLRFDQDLMRGVTDEAQRLLGHVTSVYVAERHAYVLQAGAIMIIDNNRAAHGRSDFAARFDGSDRFVIRSFIVRDLNRSRHARVDDSRAVQAAHS